MPYRSVSELPDPVRLHLPLHAQEMFRAAFNAAFDAHASDPRREGVAMRIAWAAVKRRYDKVGKIWVEKRSAGA